MRATSEEEAAVISWEGSASLEGSSHHCMGGLVGEVLMVRGWARTDSSVPQVRRKDWSGVRARPMEPGEWPKCIERLLPLMMRRGRQRG